MSKMCILCKLIIVCTFIVNYNSCNYDGVEFSLYGLLTIVSCILFMHLWLHWILFGLSNLILLLNKGYLLLKVEVWISSRSDRWCVTKFVIYIYKLIKLCGTLSIASTYRLWKYMYKTLNLKHMLYMHIVIFYARSGLLCFLKVICGIKAQTVMKV